MKLQCFSKADGKGQWRAIFFSSGMIYNNEKLRRSCEYEDLGDVSRYPEWETVTQTESIHSKPILGSEEAKQQGTLDQV